VDKQLSMLFLWGSYHVLVRIICGASSYIKNKIKNEWSKSFNCVEDNGVKDINSVSLLMPNICMFFIGNIGLCPIVGY
jgi:hypothetical protein